MVLAVVTMLAGVIVGLARGGTLQRLGSLPIRRSGWVWAAAGAQLAGALIGGPAYPLGLALSAGLVGRFLLANRGIRGTGLLALGLLANAAVVALNGAMPVSLDAAGRAGTTTQDILTGADRRHEIATADTRLPWLGDVIATPWPLRPEVVSPGDVLVAAGLGQLVALGMRHGPARGRHAGRARREPRVQPW